MATKTVSTVEIKASVKFLQTSPYKVRAVLNLVRGLAAEDAERILQLTERDAADDVLKVLESAMANAEHNNGIPADELYIVECFADEGPTRPGGRSRARGRSFKIRKRTSHVTIVLARFEEDDLETRRRKAEAAATPRGGSQRKRSERVRASRKTETPAHDHDHDHDHADDHDHDHDDVVDAVSTEIVAEDVSEVAAPEGDAPAPEETK